MNPYCTVDFVEHACLCVFCSSERIYFSYFFIRGDVI